MLGKYIDNIIENRVKSMQLKTAKRLQRLLNKYFKMYLNISVDIWGWVIGYD